MSVPNFERETISALARIETKLNIVVGEDGNGGRVADFETRIRDLESRKWHIAGVTSALSALATGALAWAYKHFYH